MTKECSFKEGGMQQRKSSEVPKTNLRANEAKAEVAASVPELGAKCVEVRTRVNADHAG